MKNTPFDFLKEPKDDIDKLKLRFNDFASDKILKLKEEQKQVTDTLQYLVLQIRIDETLEMINRFEAFYKNIKKEQKDEN